MRRLFALLLALAMVITCLPTAAFHAHADDFCNHDWDNQCTQAVCIYCGFTVEGEYHDYVTYCTQMVCSGCGATIEGDFCSYENCCTYRVCTVGDHREEGDFHNYVEGVCESCGISEATELGSGQCGDGVYWYLDDHGQMTISGEGAMYDFIDAAEQPWRDLNQSITHVKVDHGVTTIGYGAFYYCNKMEQIELPDTIVSIGPDAFTNCTSLTEIRLPESLETIREYAFWRCEGLTRLMIPASVTYIGEGAFTHCNGINEIFFAGDAPEIREDVFGQITANAYYYFGNETWTQDKQQNYGGTLTWGAYTDGSEAPDEFTIIASGTCGNELIWELQQNGTLTISGEGAMYDYPNGFVDAPWGEYRMDITGIVISL